MNSFQKAMILEQDEIVPIIHNEILGCLTKALGQEFAFGLITMSLPNDVNNPILNINIEMHPTRLFKLKYSKIIKYTPNDSGEPRLR